MKIIPAIDIKQKKLVRLTKGKFDSSICYSMSPVEAACMWEKEGAEWLHVVDLDGAKEGRLINIDIVLQILKNVSIPVQLGGGIRTESDLNKVFNMGVSRVVISTGFLEDIDSWRSLFSNYNNLAVSLDIKNDEIMIKGWTKKSNLKLENVLSRLKRLNVKLLIYTDISRDGTLNGIDINQLKKFLRLTSLPVIASGGINTLEQIENLSKIDMNLHGIIIGKALYEGKFKLKEAIRIVNRKK